ncbi:DUF3105 domain-containing protein [Nocardioides sp.]|uniref:DUF3105 domain-containing protein n=1 Tax=Nocardioides sp. TaxID=35761 RepID=UPI0031FEA92C|nr:hypothetical protein [Nocardioides sp.]
MSTLLPPGPPPGSPPPGPPAQDERNPAPLVIAGIAAVLVIALAIGVPIALRSDPEPAGPANLDAVKVYGDLGNAHTIEDVDYPQVPPVGGPHDPVWLDCGTYTEPVRDENAVHDLEHGGIWLTYGAAVDEDDVTAMAAKLGHNSIVSPYDGLPSPVVVTVWGRQLELDGADDPRLGLFLAAYGDGHTAPEPFASCAGGTQDPGGGGGASSGSGANV